MMYIHDILIIRRCTEYAYVGTTMIFNFLAGKGLCSSVKNCLRKETFSVPCFQKCNFLVPLEIEIRKKNTAHFHLTVHNKVLAQYSVLLGHFANPSSSKIESSPQKSSGSAPVI